MFIKYAPNIGRKRDKSQLVAANDTKTQESAQITQENESKAENENTQN